MVQVEVGFFSPRWGHEDGYRIVLEQDRMIVKGSAGREAICSWRENLDPKWTGDNSQLGNPVEQMLRNDGIYPPIIFVNALVYAWLQWRDEGLASEQVEKEIEELCHWVNDVTRSRPRTDFWRGCF